MTGSVKILCANRLPKGTERIAGEEKEGTCASSLLYHPSVCDA